jgi:hypothetical protein
MKATEGTTKEGRASRWPHMAVLTWPNTLNKHQLFAVQAAVGQGSCGNLSIRGMTEAFLDRLISGRVQVRPSTPWLRTIFSVEFWTACDGLEERQSSHRKQALPGKYQRRALVSVPERAAYFPHSVSLFRPNTRRITRIRLVTSTYSDRGCRPCRSFDTPSRRGSLYRSSYSTSWNRSCPLCTGVVSKCSCRCCLFNVVEENKCNASIGNCQTSS